MISDKYLITARNIVNERVLWDFNEKLQKIMEECKNLRMYLFA